MKEKDMPGSRSGPDDGSPLEQGRDEISQATEELEEALREKDQFRGMAQRAQADLINYRRRAAEEKSALRQSANSELLLKILSNVDDFNRALAIIPSDAIAPGWLDGLLLVQRNICHLLESEGVSKIEPLGLSFEPWECEAISYEETPGEEEGKVIKVLRDGYKQHDRVLRAAQVIVSKKPAPQIQSDTVGEDQ